MEREVSADTWGSLTEEAECELGLGWSRVSKCLQSRGWIDKAASGGRGMADTNPQPLQATK